MVPFFLTLISWLINKAEERSKQINIKTEEKITCPTCDGSGQDGTWGDPMECNTCMGQGKVKPSELS